MKIEILDHRNIVVAEKILDLSLASYAVEAQLIGCDDFPPLYGTVAKIQSSNGLFYGVRNGQHLLGVIEIETTSEVSEIHRLVVSPLSFRQGVASRLLSKVTSAEVNKVTLSTAELNLPAIRLYEKHGFCVCKKWLSKVTGIRLVEMQWHK